MSSGEASSVALTALGPVDEERLATLRELQEATGVDLLRDLAELFFTDVPRRAEELRAAVASGDAATAHRLAHSIKGSCSNLGARRVEKVAAEIERRAAEGCDGLAGLLDQLGVEIESACEVFEELRS